MSLQTDLLELYLEQHSSQEPAELRRLRREAHVHLLQPRMLSGHLQGRLLKMLVQLINPRNVLELGTYTAYASLCLAEGLQNPSARVHTIEHNDEMEDFTRPWIAQSPVADKIVFTIGDANLLAPQLGITFDMAFIDGDKRTYIETYEMTMKLLRVGGFLLADNTLWDGHVIDSAYEHDQQTLGIRAFNDHVLADQRVEKVILPLRDGLTLIRKIKE